MTMEIQPRRKINIYERFYSVISSEGGFRDDGCIHVSELASQCIRHAYYNRMLPIHSHNIKTMLSFWIGRKLHETPIFKNHEQLIEWEGIVGSPDDYESGNLLEKKTCTEIPAKPYPEHVNQAEYYYLMLNRLNTPIHFVTILYIDINSKTIAPFQITPRPRDKIAAELLAKRDLLKNALKTSTLPHRFLSHKCEYCSFASLCFKSGGAEE